MSGITLSPGESVDFPSGYVARSYREDRPYYAERTGDTLSPEFGTFAEARAWLELERAACTCPDDCNCRSAWRTNYCGCRGHEGITR